MKLHATTCQLQLVQGNCNKFLFHVTIGKTQFSSCNYNYYKTTNSCTSTTNPCILILMIAYSTPLALLLTKTYANLIF